MKYIELSGEEIRGINTYADAVKSIPMVECVYILPFFSEATNKIRISVITIRNNTPKYNEKLFGVNFERDIKEERDKLRTVMDGYEREFSEGRLSFIEEDAENYSLSLMNHREILSETELVSGIIVYDRFYDKVRNKRRASELLKPFPNALKITDHNVTYTYPTKSI